MLNQTVNTKPLDHIYTDRLKKLVIGKALILTDTMNEQKAWYRAAKRLNVKISIRSMPDGMKLWRLS